MKLRDLFKLEIGDELRLKGTDLIFDIAISRILQAFGKSPCGSCDTCVSATSPTLTK